MNASDLLALSPLLLIALTTVVVMLAIAFRRSHALLVQLRNSRTVPSVVDVRSTLFVVANCHADGLKPVALIEPACSVIALERPEVETSWAEFLGQHQQLGTEAPTTTIWLDVELVDPVAIEDEERDRDVGLFDQPYFLGRHDHFREPSPHVGGGVHRCWDRGNRRLARSNPQIGQVRRLLGPASSRPSPSRWVPVLHVGQHALLPRRERPIRVAPAGTLESPERHLGGWAG